MASDAAAAALPRQDHMDSNDATNAQQQQPRTFHQFSLLNEDLQIHIISFVAHVPFEEHASRRDSSLLMRALPYVSHQFHAMIQSDHLWQAGLERMIRQDPTLWGTALLKLWHEQQDASTTSMNDDDIRVDSPKFVPFVHQALNEPGYMNLFKMVLQNQLRFIGPVFIMAGVVRLGEGISLHFFEPRYRLLIARVLEGFPQESREGHVIAPHPETGEYPTFVYAHVAPFAPTTAACLVRVQQCTVHPNGSADVLLVPTAYVHLERLWEAPGTGRLHYAQCIRMPTEEVRRMEEERQQVPQGFENPLIAALLQDRGLMGGDAPMGLEGPLRALLSYVVHDQMGEFENDEEEDGAGIPAD